jgi:hypothetical protein
MADRDLILKSNKSGTEKVWTLGANGNLTVAGNIMLPYTGSVTSGPYDANSLNLGTNVEIQALRTVGGPNGGILLKTGPSDTATHTWQFGYDAI